MRRLVAKTTDGTLVPIALGVDATEATRALAALGYEDALTAEAWASVQASPRLAQPTDPVRSAVSILLSALLVTSIGLLVWGLLRGGLSGIPGLPGRRRQASFAVVHPPRAGPRARAPRVPPARPTSGSRTSPAATRRSTS